MGAVVGLPSPRSDWNQTDERKADYIKNKPTIEQLQQELGIVGINTILSELHFNRVPALEESKADYENFKEDTTGIIMSVLQQTIPQLDARKADVTYVDSAINVAIGEALEGDY